MKKSLIVLDYDNTLVDFDRSLLRGVNKFYSTNLQSHHFHTYSWSECELPTDKLGVTGKHVLQYFIDNRNEIITSISAYSDAKYFLSRCKDLNLEIMILTARHSDQIDNTLNCLKKNDLIEHVDLVIHDTAKAEFLSEIKPQYNKVFFVDDKLSEMERSYELNPDILHIVKSQNYNKDTSLVRLDNFKDIFKLVYRNIKTLGYR